MKKNILFAITSLGFMALQTLCLAQAPTLGSAANFVLFSTNGDVSNSGLSQLTGNVGTNNGSSTAFGNVNGQMHDNDGVSALCAADLLIAYNQMNATVPTAFPAPQLGNGQILQEGVYSIAGTAVLNLDLSLDALGDSNAVFIFQIQGAFSSTAGSRIILLNGAKACNVFWKVEGLISLASGTKICGTMVANQAAIQMSSGVELNGRALSTTGAVTTDGVFAYTPIGCGSPVHMGPLAPVLASTECYALFSANGPVTNTGFTIVTGDVGTNVGLTSGFDPLTVDGVIHPIPDGSTQTCADDLMNVYTYLNTLPEDIELLYPAQFGNSLVLTPHTYVLNGAITFVDTLFLNAEGNPSAVFVFKVNGAMTTSTYAKVVLVNGALAKNVFWKFEGAVEINDYSTIKGTIVVNNGAVNIHKEAKVDGRVLLTNGALTTDSVTVIIPQACSLNEVIEMELSNFATLYPNPFQSTLSITLSEESQFSQGKMTLYSILGEEILQVELKDKTTVLEPNLPAGVYFYHLKGENNAFQTGKIVSQ